MVRLEQPKTTMNAIEAVRQMRRSSTQTVTREEVDWKAYGNQLGLLREDCDISPAGMAGHIGISEADLHCVENGHGTLNLKQQVEWVKLCVKPNDSAQTRRE